MDYLEYIIKTVSERERAITGLSLKLISLRLQGEDTSEILKMLDKIRNMTDEEYDNFKKLNKI